MVRRIELRLDLPTELPLALLDANQIELALLNLVVNARDAMPEGGVLSVKIDDAVVGEGGDLAAGRYVRLVVSDSGYGMDAETLKKATEPFFSTKEVGKGTGLGLSMIQGLVSQLKGSLRLTSEVGLGTTAELWLPATLLPAHVSQVDDPVPQSSSLEGTILVVDDDALISMSTVAMLEDLGHKVIEANSGERALEILGSDGVVDLLITDYSMPRMTGAQLAKLARAVRPDLPILLATGYADLPPGAEMDLPRISKPYRQNQLAAEIVKLMRPKVD